VKNWLRNLFVVLALSTTFSGFAVNSVSTYWGSCIGTVGNVYNYPFQTCTVTSQNQFMQNIGGYGYVYCVQKFNCTPETDPNNLEEVYKKLRDQLDSFDRRSEPGGSLSQQLGIQQGR